LVTSANVRNRDVREGLADWFGDEAETRLEPGGVGLLVGQRLGPDDLYRNRLDVKYIDESGDECRKYAHIRYPAHHEPTCDGRHRQWDLRGDGCLLDELRLPWRELETERQSDPRKFRMIFQQEDVDPSNMLVDPAWIDGGTGADGILTPGCYDEERGFLEWPSGVSGLIDYVTVDPSAGNWWGIEWWAYQPESRVKYLIRGLRSPLKAGALLEWNTDRGELSGIMEDWQALSLKLGHPIKVWVLEGNSAFKHLTQYDHFRRWQQKWGIGVILHKTGQNKNDERMGVEALLPPLYRQGLKRLPRKRGDLEALRFVEAFRKELTQYPDSATSDLVMADWQAEWNLQQIVRLSQREPFTGPLIDIQLPKYLRDQQREVPMEAVA
jgi:hypothetical protein